MMPSRNFAVPGAIVVAGAVVAGALYLARTPLHLPWAASERPTATFRAPDIQDHTLGNPTAPIRIVEYCDLDVPFCKEFQKTMRAVIAEYGPSGHVSWTYRAFPNDALHENASRDAQAAECAGAEGGTEAFFAFADAWSATSTPDLDEISAGLALPAQDFAACVASGAFADEVQASYAEAAAAGATSAPFTVVSVSGRKPFVLSGALSYETMQDVVEQSLDALNLR